MIPGRMAAVCLALALLAGWFSAGQGLAYNKFPRAFALRAKRAVLASPGLAPATRREWLGPGLADLMSAVAKGLPTDLALDIFQTCLDQCWPPKEMRALAAGLLRSGQSPAGLRKLAMLMLWRRMQGLPFIEQGPDPPVRPGREAVSSRRFVATLQKWLGTPYLYGGKGAGAIDCSGFVRAVYLANGVDLPDGSWNQARAGREVGSGPLRFGDVLVFRSLDGRVNHVGIYLGQRHFVHSVKGQGVVIATLDQARFKRMYSGARRVARFRGRAQLKSWYLFS